MATDAEPTSVRNQFCTFDLTQVHVSFHFLKVLACDQGPHIVVVVGARADFQLLQFRFQFSNQDIAGFLTHRNRHGNGHAALPAGTVSGTHQRRHGIVHVRIGHHDGVVLGAAQRLDALAVCAAGLIDIFRYRCGAHERNRLHPRICQQRIHGFLVTVHQVEYTFGQARFMQQFSHQHRGGRIPLGRFEYKSITAGDGHRVHPHRHHRREVERCDTGHDAQGLEFAPAVHRRTHVLAVFAFQDFRRTTSVFDNFHTTRKLAQCIMQNLAMLFG